jgi:hypothetical protein
MWLSPAAWAGPVKFVTDRVLGQSPAVMGEQKLGRAPVAGVRHRPSMGAGFGDVVDQVEDLVIDRDHPFGFEL